jgi:TonB family protein
MNRTQTKCFAFSAIAHGLLLVVFLCAVAFRSEPEAPLLDDEIANIIPDVDAKTTDDQVSGGDPTPKASPPPAPAPKVEPLPVVKPEPPPKVEPVAVKPLKAEKEPESEPEPQKVEPDTKSWSDLLKPVKAPAKPVKPKEEKKFVLKAVSKDTKIAKATSEADEKAEAEREEQARQAAAADAAAKRAASRAAIQQWAQNSGASGGQLSGKLSSGVSIQMPGGGGGGADATNWRAMVKRIYEQYFTPPDVKKTLYADVTIVVRNDGAIVRSSISTASGSREFDRAVKEALSQVRKLPKFPENAADTQREISIRFVPPSNRSLE